MKTFENVEAGEKRKSMEELNIELTAALSEVERLAAAVAQFETVNPGADFGMADDLAEAEAKVAEIVRQMLDLVKERGTVAGAERLTPELDYRVG